MSRSCTITIGFVLTLSVHAHAQPSAIRADFHVATDGRDDWSGKLAAPNAAKSDGPFATITQAQKAVRDAIKHERRAYTVVIRGGTYRLDAPITFEPQDSGAEGAVVTYAAAAGEKPVFSGGRKIDGWKKGDGEVWTADIAEVKTGKWYFQQLFVNGERRTRARTPNEGYLNIDGFLPTVKDPRARDNPESMIGFRFKPGDLKEWDGFDDVNMFVYHSWTASLHWIKSLDEKERLVRFTAAAHWPIGYWDRSVPYTVENYKEALDAPGEWYLDRKTGVLSYWPLPGEDMAVAMVEAPILRKLLVFKGDLKEGAFVQYLRFKGLSFQHADWFVADKGEADGQSAIWLEAAVFGQGAHHIELEGCEIAHAGEYGLFLERGCMNNRVVQCRVHDLGAGGVRIGHVGNPATPHEITSHNVVDNCFIHHGGYVFPAGVGALIARSSYNTFSHNEICDFDYSGFSVGWSWGYAESSANHNIIEFNHVHNIGRGVLSDMGGIYTLGVSPGTVIRNNVFHDIWSRNYGGWGLYTDEGSSGILLENNVVYNTKTGGFHQHYGKENIVRNNILAFAREGQLQRTREEDHIAFTFERNIVYFDNGQLLASNWKNDKWKMDNNVYWDTSDPNIDFAGKTFDEWKAKGFDTNSIIADPKFVDVDKRDFRLKPDSPALKLGFQPIDTSQVGLYGDSEWTGLPKQVKHKPFTFPGPSEPPAMTDDFEATAVGEIAKYTATQEKGEGVIRVSDEQAASGKHSLKFTDKPGLDPAFYPFMFFQPNFRMGEMVGKFSLYRGRGAKFYHEWRDGHGPYHAGPSLRFEEDGSLLVGGKKLMTVPAGHWVQFEIRCALGPGSNGTFDLTITPDGSSSPGRFKNLPCTDKGFRRVNWYGFVSEGEKDSAFYIDDVSLAPAK